ncbi:MFS transporter [Rhodococcus erythropolis]|uniref:MFS transporter n=1 Tax=Rhodococcus erythropolis TaxID=1833 RepID=UPI001BE56B60|nr:MFS transporter [Rhodococcus erythropolis]MBT2263452.1 MFS transporter [Rhodococcus erythropolis]
MTDGLTTADATATSAGTRRLALISIAALLVILTNAVLFLFPPLLPVIQTQYQVTTVAAVTWIFTLLTLGGGAGFVVLPRLSDVIGDRNTAGIACAALTAGALTAAIGDSYPALLAGSTVMGFGGAAQLLPLGFLRRALGENGLATSVAVLVIATGIGIVVGMIGGGFIVEAMSLRDFFYILTACFAVTTAASILVIPHSRPADAGGSIPVLGAAWLIAWVGAILLALTQSAEWGSTALLPLGIGLLGALSWLQVQRRTSNPMFDHTLFKAPFVTVACVVIALIAAVNSAFLVLLSTYAQIDPSYLPPEDSYGLGLTSLQTGWLMVPFAVTFLIGGVVAERPVAEGRGTAVLVAGALVSAAGLALLVAAHDQQWSYLVASGVIGLGCAVVYSACFALVQTAVDETKAGMAAAMAGTAMAIGFALGSALVTTVLGSSTVTVPGTDIELAQKGLYGPSYLLTIGLAALIVITVLISRARTRAASHI